MSENITLGAVADFIANRVIDKVDAHLDKRIGKMESEEKPLVHVKCKEWWIQKHEYNSLAPTAWNIRQREFRGKLIEGQVRVIEPLSYDVVLAKLREIPLWQTETEGIMSVLKELNMIADDKPQIEKEE